MVIVACPPEAIVIALELTPTKSPRVSEVTVMEAEADAPAYPSFDAWIVTGASVAPWAAGAVTSALKVPARSVVPLDTWLPPIQSETSAPDTGAPSESVTFAIAVVVSPALTDVGTTVSVAMSGPSWVTCSVSYVQKLFTPPGMSTQPSKDPRTVASIALKCKTGTKNPSVIVRSCASNTAAARAVESSAAFAADRSASNVESTMPN